MELRDYIERGIKKAESLTTLGKILDLTQPQMSNIKAYKQHLPLAACVKLADLIGANRIDVIAAAELATEKKEDKRAYWRNLLGMASIPVLYKTDDGIDSAAPNF